MKYFTKPKGLLSSILVVLGVLTLVLVPAARPTYGQMTGTVCIVPTSANSCPSTPSTIRGTLGTQLRVSIFIQGSDSSNGWDITVLADHTILKPAGADLTGSVLGGATIESECIGGVQAIRGGFACASTATVDTIEFAVGGPQFTAVPTTGLLFTAIYNVIGTTSSIPVGFQSGCPMPTSVSGTTTCVTITNGGTALDPETVQTATFNTADYSITANPTTLTIARSSQATSTIKLTSFSGFAGTVSLSTSISPNTGHSPPTSLSANSVTLTSGGSAFSVLTVFTAKNSGFGSYTITVTGTGGTVTHVVTVIVNVTH